MQNFQDTFDTGKRSFISAFSICMTVPLICFMSLISFPTHWKHQKSSGAKKEGSDMKCINPDNTLKLASSLCDYIWNLYP